jgi:CheY-like chemotaxis protein
MKHFAYWLLKMEKMAGDFYRAAAEYYKDEENLVDFFNHLANDEDFHEKLMEKALECADCDEFAPPVILDMQTISGIEKPLITAAERISRGLITKEELFDLIIEAEFSEWNGVFLYTVNFLSKNDLDCIDIARKVQIHQKFIVKFIEMTPGLSVHLEKIKGLPIVWRDKVLFVDDEPIVLSFYKKIFEKEWSVETAANGREALDKLRCDYFDVVVSDISLPEMNGIALYQEANKIWPDIGERFLFYSANAMKYADFFRENNLKYIVKPASLQDIVAAVSSIASREVDARLANVR